MVITDGFLANVYYQSGTISACVAAWNKKMLFHLRMGAARLYRNGFNPTSQSGALHVAMPI